ncbi:hypothetical protein RMCBS344292_00693 [Rhizopus microsporus]|nr:hypothetical protein RMCBS344292_00693 [Rhizopus microsporus]
MKSDEVWAELFGSISIGCWIVVFTPQLWENYKRKNTDGVSVTFLLLWIFGDIFNLLGILLEDLLFTMLLLAAYYLFADCVLMSQVLYYRTPIRDDETIVTPTECSPLMPKPTKSDSTRTVVRFFFISSIISWLALLASSAVYFYHSDIDFSKIPLIPQLFGWISAILYCSSRIPQIMQNFKNESVEGLSLSMFIFSVVGNLTYCFSILLVSLDPTYLFINYSWLLGSGGTLFFDFTVRRK